MTYVEDWSRGGFEAMADDFGLSAEDRVRVARCFDVVHAYYCYQDYSGEAFVILRSRSDGSFWEVNGSHCSCHGLEGQWDMEYTVIEVLIARHDARALPGVNAQGGSSWILSLMEDLTLSQSTPHGHTHKPGRSAAL